MAGNLTRIKNNQVTDAAAGNTQVGINAGVKVQNYSITATKIANNLTYGSDLTITGNLTVQGTTTAVNTVNTTIQDPLIVLADGQTTGSPSVDIGYVGLRGSQNSAAFVWKESALEFVTALTTTDVGGTGLSNTTITVSSYANLHSGNTIHQGTTSLVGNLIGAVNATANITGGNLLTAGIVSATSNVTGGNLTTGGQVSATSTITGGNLATGGTASAGGNITGANILTGGLVSATANVTGGNLTTAGQVSATGNGTFGNISTAGTFSAASLSVTGNITGGNLLTAGQLSATANVTGGNVLSNGLISATTTITGGNLATAGTVSASGNITGGNVLTNGTVSAGANIIATANVTGGNVLSNGLISATSDITGGKLLTSGNVSATGNVTGGNVLTAGAVSATANVTGGNILTGGLISATGNISTGANLIVSGYETVTGNVTGGNILTAGLVSATGNVTSAANVTGGNILTAGIVSATSNITGGNVLTSGQVSATGNVTGGNVNTNNVVGTGVTITSTGTLTFAPTGNVLMSSKNINNLADPTQPQDAATKNYVDSVAQGLDPKASVVYATTTSIFGTGYTYNNGTSGVGATLTAGAVGNLTIDGTVVSVGQRVLIKNEVGTYTNNTTQSAAFNGIYVVTTAGSPSAAYVLTRSLDMDQWVEVPNAFTFVEDGSTNADTGWVSTANQGGTMGTTSITWTQFSGAGSYTANTSAGLSLIGTQFNAKVDQNTTAFDGNGNIIVKAGANLTTPNIGAATGTSLSLTGAVTAASTVGGVITGTSASVTANVTGGNVLTGGIVSATSNVTGGNVLTSGIVSATGNISTGANLIVSGYETVTGNVTGGNILTAGLVSATGNVTSAANVTGGNILTAGIVSATSNITGGNVLTSGQVSATGNVTGANSIVSGYQTVTGNITGGNILTVGIISTSGNIYGANLILTANETDSGNLTAGNLLTGGQMSATGNVTGGNILTSGLISATSTITSAANVIGGNLTTAGQMSATANITGGNVLTGGIVSATSNITGGNVLTGGIVSATGNVQTGANLLAPAGYISVSNGLISTSTYSGPYTDGIVVDYSTGNGRISMGAADGLIIYNGGVASTALVTVSPVGAVTLNGTATNATFTSPGNANIAGGTFFVNQATGSASFGSATQTVNALVAFNSSTSILLPTGNTGQRPSTGVTGMQRFNTQLNALEVYNNSTWQTVGSTVFTVIADDQFNGDGANVAFTLSTSQTTNSCIVSINGIVQIPTTAYSVSGTTLTFTEAPAAGDLIDVREITTTTSVTTISNSAQTAVVQPIDGTNTVQITGNVNPVANVTYNLGNATNNWKSLYVGGNTIYLGSLQLKDNGSNTFAVYSSDGTTPAAVSVGNISVSSITDGTSAYQFTGVNGNAVITAAGSNSFIVSPGAVSVVGNGFVSGALTVTGNLNVANINSQANLVVSDPLVYFQANSVGPYPYTYDIGFYSDFVGNPGNTYQHTGLVRDYTDYTWKLVSNIPEPSGSTLNFTNAIYDAMLSGSHSVVGNVTATTFISAVGNITGGNIITGGSMTITGASQAASYSATGNITGGNVTTAGVITVNSGGAAAAIINGGANGSGNIGSSTGTFNTIFAKATTAQYADLAEKYTADAEYAPGTVLVFGGTHEVTVNAVDADRKVAGVVSTNPGFLMNEGLDAEFTVAVALTGRVPCMVVGPVKKGDLMVAAGLGRARAEADPRVGSVIGKALEDFDGAEGTIEVVVGRF